MIAIGVIELPSFYGNIGMTSALGTTTDDVQELIEKLTLMNAQLLACEKEVDRLNEYVQIMELQGDGKEKR